MGVEVRLSKGGGASRWRVFARGGMGGSARGTGGHSAEVLGAVQMEALLLEAFQPGGILGWQRPFWNYDRDLLGRTSLHSAS